MPSGTVIPPSTQPGWRETSSQSGTRLAIGVLAMQGAFFEHVRILTKLGATVREVRLPRDLDGLDGIILPGGESTTIGKLLEAWDVLVPLRSAIVRGLPCWGTCAGAILMARHVSGTLPGQPLLSVMDISVRRNAFGRQVQSFETGIVIDGMDTDVPFPAMFIRAPKIESVGPDATAIATLDDGTIVAARQGNWLATSFHPELTSDPRFHTWFLDIALANREHSSAFAGAAMP
ncbi:MAG: pyridoxal 5'-phosphate synthase glutaminase subunit PdxT [Chloroflexi bacterium]|nr:pyridoxal 5'-phosphate synthase glutaminase subunit PdxT [Chloroflexota bacterium]